jgi:hypothetical protein
VADWQQPAANVLLSYYKSPTVALWQQEAANVLTSSLHASSFTTSSGEEAQQWHCGNKKQQTC